MDDAKPTTPPKRRSKKQRAKAAAVKAQREVKKIALRGIEKAQDAFSQSPPNIQQGIMLATFAGLTYGYKVGAIDILAKAGFMGAGTSNEARDRLLYDNALLLIGGPLGWLSVEGPFVIQDMLGLTPTKDTDKKPMDEIAAARKKLDKAKVDLERSKNAGHYRDHPEKYYEDKAKLMQAEIKLNMLVAKYEMGKWLVAMGLAGATMYLLQEYSVSELVEAVPLIE